jgi:hypothetical protein
MKKPTLPMMPNTIYIPKNGVIYAENILSDMELWTSLEEKFGIDQSEMSVIADPFYESNQVYVIGPEGKVISTINLE